MTQREPAAAPGWLFERAREGHVPAAARALLAQLSEPIELSLEILPQGDLPPGLAALIKLSGPGSGLRVGSWALCAAGQSPRVLARLGASTVVLEGPDLSREPSGIVELLLASLASATELRRLLGRLGFANAASATLRSLTAHMLGSFDLQQALRLLLSGITAGCGLGFHRAVFFRHDGPACLLRGQAAIGPADEEEAHRIWEQIEGDGGGIEQLIASYDPERFDTRLQARARELIVPLREGVPADEFNAALAAGQPLLVDPGLPQSPILRALEATRGCVLAPVRAHHRLLGVIFADDRFGEGPIEDLRLEQLSHYVEQTALICENLELLAQQRELARRDPLTGTLNRRELDERLDRVARAAREGGEPFALLILDVDRFKQLNDGRGHREGDRVLRGVAQVALQAVRSDDWVARYGGDEFVLVLQGARHAAAANVAERVGRKVRERMGVTVTLGGALFPEDGSTPAEVFAAADGRLFQAKRAGRARYAGPPAG